MIKTKYNENWEIKKNKSREKSNWRWCTSKISQCLFFSM